MDSDAEFQATLAAIKSKGQAQLTREEARARKRSLQHLNLPDFANKLQVCACVNHVRDTGSSSSDSLSNIISKSILIQH